MEKIESCQHSDCDYMNRAEYCDETMKDRYGFGDILKEECNDLLYSRGFDSLQSYRRHTSEQDYSTTIRHFQSMESVIAQNGVSEYVHAVALRHDQERHQGYDKERYLITTSVYPVGSIAEAALREYSLEIYDQGPIQTEVVEPVYSAKELTGKAGANHEATYGSRPMTEFDSIELGEALAMIRNTASTVSQQKRPNSA